MTSEMIMLRPMRRTDFPALEELVRQAWYVDDESDDNGNVPNDERGLRKYKLRKAIHLRNMHLLAAIDMHDFLSRTTEATVAERDGRVLGVVLGSLRSVLPQRRGYVMLLREIAWRCPCWQVRMAVEDLPIRLRFCRSMKC